MEKNIDEVARIDGELKLIHEKLKVIETNHLAHLKQDIDKINKLVWTIGIMVFNIYCERLNILMFKIFATICFLSIGQRDYSLF